MGQFFNQPDFITKAKAIVASDVLTTANYLDGATPVSYTHLTLPTNREV